MNPKILYHYTSLDALVSILDSEDDHITLRATQAKFFNDFKECINLFDILSSFFSDFPNGIHSINNDNSAIVLIEDIKRSFIISFSSCFDDLNMWRGYGTNGLGIALGFNINELDSYDKTSYTALIECEYDSNIIIEKWKKLYNLYYIKKEKGQYLDLTISFLFDALTSKNISFKFENEWRLCTTDANNIKFRSTGKTIIPYIEHLIPKNFVKEIIIGPCLNEDLIKEGIILLLQQRNFDLSKIEVKTSKVPYRHL